MASRRIPLVLPVRYSLGARAVQTTSQEISAEGAQLRCVQPPPPGAALRLRFYLPAAHAVAELEGRVEPGAGPSSFWVAFTAAAPQARERLAALLAAHDAGALRTPQPLGALYPRRLDEPLVQESDAAAAAAPEVQAPLGEARLSARGGAPGHRAPDGQNRRGFPRHRARFLVRFESVQEFVLQYAANISAGGVFVATDFPPPMESLITVVLELPGAEGPVSARALVVHRVTPEQAQRSGAEAGAGVQFVEADDAFREAIDRAIEHILRAPRGEGEPR